MQRERTIKNLDFLIYFFKWCKRIIKNLEKNFFKVVQCTLLMPQKSALISKGGGGGGWEGLERVTRLCRDPSNPSFSPPPPPPPQPPHDPILFLPSILSLSLSLSPPPPPALPHPVFEFFVRMWCIPEGQGRSHISLDLGLAAIQNGDQQSTQTDVSRVLVVNKGAVQQAAPRRIMRFLFFSSSSFFWAYLVHALFCGVALFCGWGGDGVVVNGWLQIKSSAIWMSLLVDLVYGRHKHRDRFHASSRPLVQLVASAKTVINTCASSKFTSFGVVYTKCKDSDQYVRVIQVHVFWCSLYQVQRQWSIRTLHPSSSLLVQFVPNAKTVICLALI